MRTTQTVLLILLTAGSVAVAQHRQQEAVLNLKGLQVFRANAMGTRLLLSVTGQPPDLLSLVKPTPTPQGHDVPRGRSKVHVLLGKDVLGLAEVSSVSEQSMRLTVSTNATKTKFIALVLTFDTPEQAAGAAKALRPDEATPTPLQKPNETK